MPTSITRSRLLAAGLASTTLVAGVLVAPSSSSAAAAVESAFGGTAYGSTGRFGSVFDSGRSALLPLCTTKIGVTRNNDTQRSVAPNIGTVGSVKTQVATRKSGAKIASITTATTGATRLFGGSISANVLTAVAKAAHNASGYSLTGSTTFANLKIAGKAMPSNPAVDQKVQLPGVGYVILNQQARSHSAGTYRLTVTALHVVVGSGNALKLPAGTLVISSAQASLHIPIHHVATGSAFGTRVQSGSVVRSGNTAPSYLPCGGSNGATSRNSTGTVSSTGLHGAAVHTSARSTDNAKATTVVTRAEVAGVNLLNGAIKASAITGQATVTRSGTSLKRSSAGTTIAGFTINGKKQAASQPANTKLSIPGLGTLYVNRVVRSSTGVHVYALQLVLTKDRAGLSKGTTVTVGAAYAAVAGS